MIDSRSGIKELSVEYFIISVYLLIRHLSNYYVMNDESKIIIREFIYDFHRRTKSAEAATNMNLLTFSNRRQQGEHDVETRDIIVRQEFFEYLKKNNKEIIEKDSKRAFTELERIIIYRDGKGLCQECLREGKSENESKVSWSNYQADHVVPHAKGGRTSLDNSELLCSHHNQSKGDRIKA